MKPNSLDEFDLHERLARHLDWNLLRIYIAIVQYGGISRAAEQVHLSQPAVSQSLQRLEAHLERKLIERNARKFEITEVGQVIYERALEIHNQISHLGEVGSQEEDRITGHLRLMFASRLQTPILDGLLKQFHDLYPRVTFRVDVLTSAEIQAAIQQGLASIGFCLVRGEPKDLKKELLLRQRFGLYCGKSHQYFGKTNLSASALRHQDFITFPSDQIGGVLSPLTIYREQHVYEGRVVAMSYNLDEILRLTIMGIGIGLLPTHIGKRFVESGQLWRLPPHRGIGPIDIYMVWNPITEMSDCEQAFLDFARSHLKQYPIAKRTQN